MMRSTYVQVLFAWLESGQTAMQDREEERWDQLRGPKDIHRCGDSGTFRSCVHQPEAMSPWASDGWQTEASESGH